MKLDRKSLALYAVTDRHWLNGRTLYDVVGESIEGGVTWVQLREKDMDEEEFLKEAIEIKKLCDRYGVPYVINDNVEIAKKSDADGVHVGQCDMDVKRAREILGEDKIIGVSVGSVKEALIAEENGADYLGVGAVFPTNSKADANDVSIDTLREICDSVNIPVVAIGGITKENIGKLSGSGIDGVAVISAIYAQDNILEATRQLREVVDYEVCTHNSRK